MSQNDMFAEGEGDAWYLRNRSHLQSISNLKFRSDIDFVCSELAPHQNDINAVLEVGCSNGLKLEYVCRQLNAAGKGIEPSQKAVEDGNARIGDGKIELAVGSSDSIVFPDNEFDLVNFGFCLYFCDRSKVLRSISEADRVLRPGGFLVITDFDAGPLRKNQYVHKSGIFSFKQDYSAILLATSAYHLVAKRSYSHSKPFFDTDPDERVATWILYKRADTFD